MPIVDDGTPAQAGLWAGAFQAPTGQAINNVPVHIYTGVYTTYDDLQAAITAGETTLATLYASHDYSTPGSNPLSTDSLGNAYIFAVPGDYTWLANGTVGPIHVDIYPGDAGTAVDSNAADITVSVVGDAASAGISTLAAAADHRHGREAFGTAISILSVGESSSPGLSPMPARSDHVHGVTSSLFPVPIMTVTNATNLIANGTQYLVKADASGGAFSVTLPAASTATGQSFLIRKADSTSNAVTVARTGSDLIDGATSFVLQREFGQVEVVSDGTGWNVVSTNVHEAGSIYSSVAFTFTAAGTWYTIPLASTEYLCGSVTADGVNRLTIAKPGIYHVYGQMALASTTGSSSAGLMKNGTGWREGTYQGTSSANYPINIVEWTGPCAAGDFFQLAGEAGTAGLATNPAPGGATWTGTGPGNFLQVSEIGR